MIRHTEKTWRLVAHIREMAQLGCSGPQIAKMLGVTRGTVGVLGCRHKISFVSNRMESPIRRAVREGYAARKSPAQIADETGSPVASVRVIASQLGLTAHTTRDPAKFRRGFEVPAARMNEYKALRKLGMTFKECGYEMGLLQRPHTRPLNSLSVAISIPKHVQEPA